MWIIEKCIFEKIDKKRFCCRDKVKKKKVDES